MDKVKEVIVIGLRGFPYGMATTQKLLLMCKSMINAGFECTVISNSYIKKEKLNEKLEKIGSFEGVNYLTTSPYVFSPKSLAKRMYAKVKGIMSEFLYITRNRKSVKAIQIYSMSFAYTLFWSIYARLLRKPVHLIYFELRSSCSNRSGFFKRFNDKLFDRFAAKFVNGIITISESLIQHIQHVAPGRKIIKIPPLVDFSCFNLEQENIQESYFLYCGSLSYIEVINFIISSYNSIKENHNYKLYLIVNGSKHVLEELRKSLVTKKLDDRIFIFSGLSNQELIRMYLNSKALLIPLRNTSQDTARFPQKIAEYCASRKPIITTQVGEINQYFDHTSAIIAKHYDIEEFGEKMQWVIQNPELCHTVADNAYRIGKEYFDYHSYTETFYRFINRA